MQEIITSDIRYAAQFVQETFYDGIMCFNASAMQMVDITVQPMRSTTSLSLFKCIMISISIHKKMLVLKCVDFGSRDVEMEQRIPTDYYLDTT